MTGELLRFREILIVGWLTTSKNGIASYCTLCQTELRSHKTDLIKHSMTSKHKLKANALGKNQASMERMGI